MLFSRFQLFSLFFGIVFIFVYNETILLVCFGKVTKGEYIGSNLHEFRNRNNAPFYFRNSGASDSYYKPIVAFKVENANYFFETTSNVDYYIGKKVKVVYLGSPPTSRKVYSFMGLWYEGILWLLVPTAFLISVFAGLMSKEEIIYINLKKKPYFRKMKRVEFDIIRKDEFDEYNENEIENESDKIEN